MSLRTDEFTAAAPAIPLTPPTRSVRLLTGREPPDKEPTVPTGVYPRKKRAEKVADKPAAAPTGKPAKERKPRGEGKGIRARRSSATGPRFGVFEDGTIQLALPGCSGTIAAEDARALVGFLRKIGIEA